MTEPEELEDDLFADLYDGDDAAPQDEAPPDQGFDPAPAQPPPATPVPTISEPISADPPVKDEQMNGNGYAGDSGGSWNAPTSNEVSSKNYTEHQVEEDSRPIGIKEDGKMFIGGLNWETTDQSLKDYFSTFGEVSECTVMRDGATGRSRGFGFLTFRDPRTVNIVMVKEHYLDGKIIDPKRAIPRDEQERTSKIFVGGVSQEANEQIFKEYFAQYGRVVDATLMMDKDTGRPRGFGFVTFDSEAAVENTLNGDLTILGKPIEVKKAQPRGDMQDGGESLGRGGRDRRGGRKGGYDDRYDNNNNGMNGNQGGNNNQQGNMNGTSGMTPQMMAQYWQKMQQYFATMQQQMAMAQGGMGGMGGMNPQMMQQMQAMQQMQQMKAMQMAQQQQQQGQGSGSASPMPPRSPSANAQMPAANMQGMNPQQMMQQMQQMQQMQAMQQAQMAGSGTPGGGGGGGRGTPGFNAQEQMAFEQRKYEEQQARRAMQEQGGYHAGGPTSWEGMYDDVPAPEHHGGGGRGRGRGRGGGGPGPERVLTPQSAPPANAPTGPKNAGKPGANYRGGGSRGGPRGFHPYAR